MKKIMFNDKYGLTAAVLGGRKTMTRRIITGNYTNFSKVLIYPFDGVWHYKGYDEYGYSCILHPYYSVGEEVAVAQRYIDLKDSEAFYACVFKEDPYIPLECIKGEKGAYNKMFAKAAWMPNRIRITRIKAERLQDITYKDCLREGVIQSCDGFDMYTFDGWTRKKNEKSVQEYTNSAELAFAALIDKISGKGTWEKNPWVWAYEFELV